MRADKKYPKTAVTDCVYTMRLHHKSSDKLDFHSSPVCIIKSGALWNDKKKKKENWLCLGGTGHTKREYTHSQL